MKIDSRWEILKQVVWWPTSGAWQRPGLKYDKSVLITSGLLLFQGGLIQQPIEWMALILRNVNSLRPAHYVCHLKDKNKFSFGNDLYIQQNFILMCSWEFPWQWQAVMAFLCGISKGTFEIPYKISYCTLKDPLLYKVEI